MMNMMIPKRSIFLWQGVSTTRDLARKQFVVSCLYGGFLKWGVPQNGWFVMEKLLLSCQLGDG